MAHNVITYDSEGRILTSGRFQHLAPVPGVTIMEVATPLEHDEMRDLYVADGDLALRPVLNLPDGAITADGEDTYVAALPAGTRIVVDGEEVGRDDGFAFATFEPGVALVEFDPPFPWRGCSVRIVAR